MGDDCQWLCIWWRMMLLLNAFTWLVLKTLNFFLFFLRRYNFGEVLAFQKNSFSLERFLMQFFQFVIFIFVMSLFTSSSHLLLGLPSGLVNAGDHSYTFLPYCYLALKH
jgi:hypothetical protein